MDQIKTIIRRADDNQENRFYEEVKIDEKTKEEEQLWCYPSVTTILNEVYPTGYYLQKWIRDHGDHGRAEFEKASDRGTEVHTAIETLLKGEPVPVYEDMSLKVKRGIQAFIDWYDEVKPEILATEHIIFNPNLGYAGTCDLICKIGDDVYVIDYKTSSSLHKQHEVQLAAYAKAQGVAEEVKGGLLHLGNRTKKRYSFKEIDLNENWKLFKHFKQTYDILFPNAKPKNEKYPEAFILNQ